MRLVALIFCVLLQQGVFLTQTLSATLSEAQSVSGYPGCRFCVRTPWPRQSSRPGDPGDSGTPETNARVCAQTKSASGKGNGGVRGVPGSALRGSIPQTGWFPLGCPFQATPKKGPQESRGPFASTLCEDVEKGNARPVVGPRLWPTTAERGPKKSPPSLRFPCCSNGGLLLPVSSFFLVSCSWAVLQGWQEPFRGVSGARGWPLAGPSRERQKVAK